MKNIALAAASLCLAASAGFAGEIQRDSDRSQILFEDGNNYVEFSTTVVTPDINQRVIVGVWTGGIGQYDRPLSELRVGL